MSDVPPVWAGPWFRSIDDIAAQVVAAGGCPPGPGIGLDRATLRALNQVALQRGVHTANALALHFVPAETVAGQGAAAYEQRIATTGQVATRTDGEGAVHDWFNALAWLGWPRTKAALNAAQAQATAVDVGADRSPWRDALTLFDENGALFISNEPRLADALRSRDWLDLFWHERDAFLRQVQVLVLGHGLLQRLQAPYKAVCAHALIIETSPRGPHGVLDALAAESIGRRTLSKQALQPLPLLGVPGWWPDNERLDFYLDANVFRSRRAAPSGAGAHPGSSRRPS